MKVVINLFCDSFADPRHALDFRDPGARDRARRAEMVQERLLATGADARDLVERRAADRLLEAGPMRADRKTVRLVAQALQEIEDGVARLEREGRPPGEKEPLAARIAVGSLGDCHDRHIADPELGEDRLRLRQLPLSAIDQHQIGPHAALALRIFFQRAIEAPAEHLPHHRVIIPTRRTRFTLIVIPGLGGAESPESMNTGFWNMDSGLAALRRPGMTDLHALHREPLSDSSLSETVEAADVEFAVGVFHQPIGTGNDHRADRVAALDMAVVVDLDAIERPVQTECLGDAVEQLPLRRAFGEPAAERLARGQHDAVDEPLLVAALRNRELDAPTPQGQRLFDKLLLNERMAQQHDRRFRLVVVELADKRGQHLLDRELSVMPRKIGAVAPVLAAAEKEHLDAGLTAGLIGRDDIGIDDAADMNVLVPLHQ